MARTRYSFRSTYSQAAKLVHLDDVIREGERAGFHAIGLRDLRSHHALTCRCWVENLQRNAAYCRVPVGQDISNLAAVFGRIGRQFRGRTHRGGASTIRKAMNLYHENVAAG